MRMLTAMLIGLVCCFAHAQPATTQSASISPDAAKVLDAMQAVYGRLTSLELIGKISGDFDVDGQVKTEDSSFKTNYAAPNKFRQQMGDEVVIGSTGEKMYVYSKQRNAYLSIDAPKEKVLSSDLPDPFSEILGPRNLSLALAMSSDPVAELKRGFATIKKADAIEVDRKSYTALSLVGLPGDAAMTLLIDPDTSLIRRTSMDVTPELKSRGAKDVKKAVVTVDYANVAANAPTKPQAFAWTPPAGAKDAADIGAAGGGDVADHILKDKPAPDFKLKGLDDKEVALADLKGSVVVLDFWATWCGPCVASLPKLDKLAKETAEQGVKIFAVNQGEDKELVSGFMKSRNLTVPVLLDTDSKVGNEYNAQAIPETVIIGKDGVVRAVFVGSGSEEKIRDAVEEATKAKD